MDTELHFEVDNFIIRIFPEGDVFIEHDGSECQLDKKDFDEIIVRRKLLLRNPEEMII